MPVLSPADRALQRQRLAPVLTPLPPPNSTPHSRVQSACIPTYVALTRLPPTPPLPALQTRPLRPPQLRRQPQTLAGGAFGGAGGGLNPAMLAAMMGGRRCSLRGGPAALSLGGHPHARARPLCRRLPWHARRRRGPGADMGALFGNPAMMSMMTGMMAQPGFLESIEAMNVRRGKGEKRER